MPETSYRSPAVRTLACVAGLALSAFPCAGARAQDASTGAAPPWMAAFEASKDQPIGMDEGDLKTYLDKQLKSEWKKAQERKKDWDKVWTEVFLLMTPATKRAVPAFHLSKYEVTNAQWEKFLEFRRGSIETKGGETLIELASSLWSLDTGRQGADVKRGWETLLRDNAGDLMPVLNPKGDAKWDPLVARAAESKLPKGIKVSYPLYLPPPHWTGGKVPDFERKKPMRFLPWEQAVDFCEWAGLHLPSEFEWERAARGAEGRWFPWGNAFDPLRAVWLGYNAAAIKANKAETPPLAKPGEEPNEVTPFPADVDALTGTATPEGVLHMIGNVSEFTSSRSGLYEGSKSAFKFGSMAVIARGGNYTDKAELLLAADRNAESHSGALLPSHSIDGYGFRVAAYPVAGADLTALLAQRYNDASAMDGPFQWLPPAPGYDTRKSDNEIYLGFEPQRTAGILKRQIASDSPDHVFVTGPATGIAFLPVRGFSMETVKTVGDLQKLAAIPDRPVVLGVLTGTAHAGFTVLNAAGEKVQVSFSDPRLHLNSDERVQTKETMGAILVYEAPRILVYVPNTSLNGPAKYREGLLGSLEIEPEVTMVKGVPQPSGTMQGDLAVLETSIPLLDRKNREMVGDMNSSFRVSIRVPFQSNGAK